jgi:Tfp pilus assembly protein PilX
VRHLLKTQDGVALPVATAMMLVISLFVVGFFTVSLRVNDTSIADRSTKRALAAAEAGLQTALYRLNQIRPAIADGMCLTTGPVAPNAGECDGYTEQLGNGAQFAYYVTPTAAYQPVGSTCVLLPGQTATAADRCITAIGTAGGISRRVQVRVSNTSGPVTFKDIGLLGDTLVHAGNSAEITSDVGTNGTVQFGNSAKTFASPSIDVDGAVLLGPGATYTTQGSSQEIAGGQQSVAAFEFPTTDFEAAELGSGTSTAVALNLRPGWDRPSNSTYNATTKQFTIGNSRDVTMPPGTYYFCRVSLENSAKWKFDATQPTRIYVDSPSRTGSQCAGQADPAGTFYANNSVEINKEAGREDLLDVFVHGTTSNGTRSAFSGCTPAGDPPHTGKCKSDFVLGNSVHFEGSVYAPNTTVEANNSVTWVGAIGADTIRANNSFKFELTSAVKDSGGDTSGAAERRGWLECRPSSTVAGDPESGC